MVSWGARWCARADAIFDVPGIHVLDVEIDDQGGSRGAANSLRKR